MTSYRAETKFHYCDQTHYFYLIVRIKETQKKILELRFTPAEYVVLLNSAVFEFEDNFQSPFPLDQPVYVQDEQQEILPS